jgi:hypothetical protein
MKWLYRIMGLKDKVESKKVDTKATTPTVDSTLTDKEAAFVVTKLRQATYQGTEFEVFYQVMAKLQKIAEKK